MDTSRESRWTSFYRMMRNLNPLPMGIAVQENSNVHAALVIGNGSFQSGLLVEYLLRRVRMNPQICSNRSGTSVQMANYKWPGHRRFSKSLVVVGITR